jgi:hypothetical protein
MLSTCYALSAVKGFSHINAIPVTVHSPATVCDILNVSTLSQGMQFVAHVTLIVEKIRVLL